jgi:hypothetical protein
MSTVPTLPAGLTARMCPGSIQVTLDAELAPNFTEVPPLVANSEPKMSTVVPPLGGPWVGLTLVIFGGESVTRSIAVPQSPPAKPPAPTLELPSPPRYSTIWAARLTLGGPQVRPIHVRNNVPRAIMGPLGDAHKSPGGTRWQTVERYQQG